MPQWVYNKLSWVWIFVSYFLCTRRCKKCYKYVSINSKFVARTKSSLGSQQVCSLPKVPFWSTLQLETVCFTVSLHCRYLSTRRGSSILWYLLSWCTSLLVAFRNMAKFFELSDCHLEPLRPENIRYQVSKVAKRRNQIIWSIWKVDLSFKL